MSDLVGQLGTYHYVLSVCAHLLYCCFWCSIESIRLLLDYYQFFCPKNTTNMCAGYVLPTPSASISSNMTMSLLTNTGAIICPSFRLLGFCEDTNWKMRQVNSVSRPKKVRRIGQVSVGGNIEETEMLKVYIMECTY